jgi:hypothetical protein
MKTLIKTLLLVLASQSLACARHVVLEPDKALQKNSQDWTIQQEPRTSPAPAASKP